MTYREGPEVYISFRRKDVRNDFVSFLDHALREANINVFTGENELLGTDLVNILKRIEVSEIALVIFSKGYTSSYWCLEKLAKIKERKDQGRLQVIPIFYKLEPSVVKHLQGDYGDNFRDLKRNYLNQPEKTQKWEEALVSIPESIGMCLAEQSDVASREFINSMVFKIQRLLENMAMRGNSVPELNRQAGSMVPSRQPERKESHQRGSVVSARQLEITHSENPQKWAWSTIDDDAPNSAAIEIATMIQIQWLKIVGTFKTEDLTPGTKYEVVFVIKLEDDAIGWEQPVRLILKLLQHDGDNNRVDGTENLNGYIGHNWVDVLAGVFEVPLKKNPATISFTMYQYETNYKKRGLVVKGVAIRPTN